MLEADWYDVPIEHITIDSVNEWAWKKRSAGLSADTGDSSFITRATILTEQTSNLAHELSHILLEHEPTPVSNADGKRYWNSEMEEEATWLGGAFSEVLCRWRITQSGVDKQAQRWRSAWGR
jgi:hypothetical protein